jgi:hypothetical protein
MLYIYKYSIYTLQVYTFCILLTYFTVLSRVNQVLKDLEDVVDQQDPKLVIE